MNKLKKHFRNHFILHKKQSSYVNGGIVILVSLLLLMYLFFIQTYEIFWVKAVGEVPSFSLLFNNFLKCTVMVLAMSMLWYFYSIQEYHTVMNDLMDIFSITQSKESSLYPYSKNQELASLVNSASGLIQTNQLYESQLENQKKLLMKNYIMRLMKGRTRNIPAAYLSGEAFGVDLRASNLQVLVFSIADTKEAPLSDKQFDEIHEMIRILATKMLFAFFQGHLAEVDGMLACLLFPHPGETLKSKDCTTELKRISTLIQQIIQDKTDCLIRIAVGSVSSGISGIEKSFSEAMELFQYAEIMKENDSILMYREMPAIHMVDQDDYFWFKKEMQFMNCINTADYHNAATVFFEILDSEYINSDLPLKLINCRMLGLINAMINALGKIRLTMDVHFFEQLDPWNTILNCSSLPELKKRSKEIFHYINHYTENQKRQSSYTRMTEIVEYMKENYQDPNLTITSTADHFHLNPSYLSRIFKKMLGISFSDYLQWLRIEEAKELMKNKKLSVREISELVGYSGVQTMNRAFKKLEGTTAGKLKNGES